MEPAKQAALRILIVDDNATNRLLLAQQLRAGHHVLVADGGAAALALWRENQPDRVITDCNMPEMDGFEFTRQLRAEEKRGATRVPVYGLTAMAEERVAQLAQDAGMNGCLFKPLERAQLLQVITGAPMNPTRDDTLLTLENLAANNPQAWRDGDNRAPAEQLRSRPADAGGGCEQFCFGASRRASATRQCPNAARRRAATSLPRRRTGGGA